MKVFSGLNPSPVNGSVPAIGESSLLRHPATQPSLERGEPAAGSACEAMTRIGLTLARRMYGPESGKCIIDQLVGMAMGSQFLKLSDPAGRPEFLGMPVKDQLEELAQRKAEVKRRHSPTASKLPLPFARAIRGRDWQDARS